MAAEIIAIRPFAALPAADARAGISLAQAVVSPPGAVNASLTEHPPLQLTPLSPTPLSPTPLSPTPLSPTGGAASLQFGWPGAQQLRHVLLTALTIGWTLIFVLPVWFSLEQLGIALIVSGLVVIVAAVAIPSVSLFTRSCSTSVRWAVASLVTLAASAALAGVLLLVSL